MKHFLVAAATLGLIGAVHTASADPLQATNLTIWSTAIPMANQVKTDPTQQALPTAVGALNTAAGGNAQIATGVASGPINFNDGPTGTGTNTIKGFLDSDNPNSFMFANCGMTCQNTTLSLGEGTSSSTPAFSYTSLFEVVFSIATSGTLTITHDDGVSVYSSDDMTEILNAAAPTSEETSVTALMGPGTYHLWYTAANGLPEVLETNFEPVPAPLLGHGLVAFLTVGGLLFGAKMWGRDSRKRLPAAA